MDSIDLTGLVDLHVHTSPDIRARYGDDLQIAREAAEAGMRGVLIKSHWTLTADRAAIAEKVVPGISVRGGLALNSTVGWLNPRAVELALQLGARQIWMPTFDVARPGGWRLDEPVLYDAEGRIRSELYQVLDLVREADVILGTGHLPVAEILALVRLARERGLRKILVTHPEATFIGMSVAAQEEIRGEGVYYERCYNDVRPLDGEGMSLEELAAQIRQVGMESTVLSTDYGQAEHPAPSQGLRECLAGLLETGFSWPELQRMAGETPAYLMGV